MGLPKILVFNLGSVPHVITKCCVPDTHTHIGLHLSISPLCLRLQVMSQHLPQPHPVVIWQKI